MRDLNFLYRTQSPLAAGDGADAGFRWIDCSDAEQSVVAYGRVDPGSDACVLVVCNFTPVPRHEYRVGAPYPGAYRELLNTDAVEYGGSGLGNLGAVATEPVPCHDAAQSLRLTLPPLAALILQTP